MGDNRCLSSASTCATSPPPRSISPPLSPDYDFDAGIESPLQAQQPQCPPGALDKSSWLQARKVFVGGVPQIVDNDGLFHMFSKIGKVKKAWVQFHSDHGGAHMRRHHRGFGFVIFYENHSIDRLLGEDSSRFVCFGDTLKLEVKRAINKDSLQLSE